ncbi:MAG: beta-ketoacyl-[acyl-carrier-protein] synthase II, partial [Betaproteobacteria bacterium]
MKRCYIQAVGVVSALGEGLAATRAALMRGDTRGMRIESGWLPDGNSCVGRVTTELAPLPAQHAEDDCRNNRLLATAF